MQYINLYISTEEDRIADCYCTVARLHTELLCFIDSDIHTALFMVDMTTTVILGLLVFILGVKDRNVRVIFLHVKLWTVTILAGNLLCYTKTNRLPQAKCYSLISAVLLR